jgi:hypothetical protein
MTSPDPRDPFVPAMAEALLSCLSVAVSGNPGTPEHIAYRVGSEIAADIGQMVDFCCEGIAYVALGDMWPTAHFPEQDLVRQANTACSPPAWGVQFKVGIVRCVPTGDLDFPPTDAEWTAAFIQNMWDAQALRRTECCFRTWVRSRTDALLGMSIVMGRQIQGTPLGGCVERYFTIDAQFPNCDC